MFSHEKFVFDFTQIWLKFTVLVRGEELPNKIWTVTLLNYINNNGIYFFAVKTKVTFY